MDCPLTAKVTPRRAPGVDSGLKHRPHRPLFLLGELGEHFAGRISGIRLGTPRAAWVLLRHDGVVLVGSLEDGLDLLLVDREGASPGRRRGGPPDVPDALTSLVREEVRVRVRVRVKVRVRAWSGRRRRQRVRKRGST